MALNRLIRGLKVKVAQSCLTLCDPMDYISPWNSPGQNTGVGSCSLLKEIFPTQESNSGLPHCRRILYQLSHQGSQRILKWVAYPFSRGSSWPRNQTGVSCIAGRFLTNWAIREASQSVQSLSHVRLFVTPWTAARQASLSTTNSRSLLKFMSTELVMPSNHLILCHPLLLPPSIFPSIRVFSNESVLRIRWPKYPLFKAHLSITSWVPENFALILVS